MTTNLIIATATLVKSVNEVRAQLVLKTAEEAKRLGYKLVVVDASTPPEFKKSLEVRGSLVFHQEESTMGAARRQAIRIAGDMVAKGGGSFVFMEPERHTLVSLLKPTFDPVLRNEADLVVPGRKSLDSYPGFQKYAELIGNEAFKMATGLDLDNWFGPRVIGRKAFPFFAHYQAEDWGLPDAWDATHIPTILCIAAGLRVMGVEVDYEHPLEQLISESTPEMLIKRLDQLDNLARGTLSVAKKIGLLS